MRHRPLEYWWYIRMEMPPRDPQSIRTALITGIAGSGGSYMADWIVEHQPHVAVHGLSRWHSTQRDNLAQLAGRITLHECDLQDFGSVFAALQKVRPDAIFHLAAHANVRASFTTPASVLANNILSTSNLFEAIRLSGQDPWIQLCSTSEVYGQVRPEDVPIKEDAPLRPVSPYAVSKVAQDLLGFVYFTSYKMKVIRTRMFTYVNPRRPDLFATAFARQVARVERRDARLLARHPGGRAGGGLQHRRRDHARGEGRPGPAHRAGGPAHPHARGRAPAAARGRHAADPRGGEVRARHRMETGVQCRGQPA
jgi:nucleoside-diphosphate-sugar epimerase